MYCLTALKRFVHEMKYFFLLEKFGGNLKNVEKEVIQGAVSIIKKYKPKLAISIFHCPDDLWESPYL